MIKSYSCRLSNSVTCVVFVKCRGCFPTSQNVNKRPPRVTPTVLTVSPTVISATRCPTPLLPSPPFLEITFPSKNRFPAVPGQPRFQPAL